MNNNTIFETFKIQDFYTAGIVKMAAATKKLHAGFDDADKKASAMMKRIGNSKRFAEFSDEVPALGNAMRLLASPMAMAGSSALAVGAGLSVATAKAIAFDKQMAESNVTAKLQGAELANVRERLLKIGSESYGNFDMVNPAFNSLISGGVSVENALKGLPQVAKAAAAGFVDMGVAADVAVNLMNSTGIQDATKIFDVAFATVDKGKVKFSEVAQYMPLLVPQVKALGYSFEDAAGSFAFLTTVGKEAPRAQTELENLYKSIANGNTIKNFEGAGIELFDKAGARRDILDIVGDVKGLLDANVSAEAKTNFMGSLGLDMEASGALNSMVQNYDKYKTILTEVRGAQGNLDKAFKDSANFTRTWGQVMDKVNYVLTKVGMKVLPLVDGALQGLLAAGPDIKFFGKVVFDAFEGMYKFLDLVFNNALGKTVLAIGSLIYIGGLLIPVIKAINVAMWANPYVAVAAGVVLLAGGMYSLYQNSETVRRSISGIVEVGRVLGQVIVGIGTGIAGLATGNFGMIKAGAQMTTAAFAALPVAYGAGKEKYDVAHGIYANKTGQPLVLRYNKPPRPLGTPPREGNKPPRPLGTPPREGIGTPPREGNKPPRPAHFVMGGFFLWDLFKNKKRFANVKTCIIFAVSGMFKEPGQP